MLDVELFEIIIVSFMLFFDQLWEEADHRPNYFLEDQTLLSRLDVCEPYQLF